MGNNWELFQKFLITENSKIEVSDLLWNTLIVVILSIILEFTYARCAKSLSNRKLFANNFLLITFTTMVIITIVKSSLALSLGLVGALSIVRFRAAIKEPEELAYLFFTIAVGLGLGANQRIVTLVAFGLLMVIIWGRHFIKPRKQHRNLFLTLRSDSKSLELESIGSLIKEHFPSHALKRLDDDNRSTEASYHVDVKKPEQILGFKNSLHQTHPEVKVGFIDIEN
ncbi:MAG: DUF4956 domain-containing protein [Flavobacteriales bacterium]|nr:DUF4956 domain-containing protein [Flavobacteriales bacterium]